VAIAKLLAAAYWEQRPSRDIDRDTSAGVNNVDYERWVISEIIKIKMGTIYS
jgi:hypothetical protein